ncbi:sugar transferase [Sunxiuqinia rutila]|uniref:sugar transferase n=1 Tax=Sunxiuqinia rutila TaxID=1397841 RepID=UPI003D36057F
MRLAPICLFTYNRLAETEQTIEYLKNNFLAKQSELFIFSDSYKNEQSKPKVKAVRDYIRTVDGFKSVTIFEMSTNLGLANSIISGVSKIIKKYGKAIVLEDDLITSSNFLDYMNQSLDYYEFNSKVFSIAGYSIKVNTPADFKSDVYFKGRATSWGWATWEDRWNSVDWELNDINAFFKSRKQKRHLRKHGDDLLKILRDYTKGRNDSWAIRFAYNQIKSNKVSVAPVISKVRNIGFGGDATHCKAVYNRDKILFDVSGKRQFNLTPKVHSEPKIERQLRLHSSKPQRALGKILNYLIRKKIISSIGNIRYVK